MEHKTLWDRTVELTIRVGERILAPIERFIGKRSLVGDATFFPLERFPWVEHIEDNWEVIRDEAAALLDDRDALANFQDISKDQIEITDDDRWKTFFIYGYGFEAKLGVEMCPRTAALMREIPGMKTAMISILSPAQAHPRPPRPVQGRAALPPRPDRPRGRRELPHPRRRGLPPLGGGARSMIFDDTFNHEVWNDTDETRVVLFVDVMRPLPSPESAINEGIVKAIGVLAVRPGRQAQPGGVGRALPRAAARCARGRRGVGRLSGARSRPAEEPLPLRAFRGGS